MKEKDWRTLCGITESFLGRKVAVAGDFVLDRFWYGHVQRVSREAPVPVVRLSASRYLLGCAANTVSNLAALGARPLPVGVIGEDPEGELLLELLRDRDVAASGLVRDPSWITPTKTRVLAGSPHGSKQQLVRVDSGEENAYAPSTVQALRDAARPLFEEAEAVILSDYGYGLLEAMGVMDLLGSDRRTALDSRFAMDRFPGVTTATPNEEEFADAAGEASLSTPEALETGGEALRSRLGMEALLVTRGKRGMSLFEEGKAPLHLPVVGPDEVVDVTGAGDTVMATYVLALCAGAGYTQAAQLANIAGGIVVQKHGTATTDAGELRDRIRAWGEGRI